MTAALDLHYVEYPVAAGPEPVRPLATVTVLCPPADTRSTAPLRLTHRGVVVLSFAVAVLGSALVWLAAASAPASAPRSTSGLVTGAGGHSAVTVQSGDTLWSIASRVAPNRDPRVEVAALQQANGLHTSDVATGQLLRLP